MPQAALQDELTCWREKMHGYTFGRSASRLPLKPTVHRRRATDLSDFKNSTECGAENQPGQDKNSQLPWIEQKTGGDDRQHQSVREVCRTNNHVRATRNNRNQE